jgi:hypothetical protein
MPLSISVNAALCHQKSQDVDSSINVNIQLLNVVLENSINGSSRCFHFLEFDEFAPKDAESG